MLVSATGQQGMWLHVCVHAHSMRLGIRAEPGVDPKATNTLVTKPKTSENTRDQASGQDTSPAH